MIFFPLSKIRIKKYLKGLVYCIALFIFLEFSARAILKFYPPYPNCNAVWRLMWKERHKNKIEIYSAFEIYDSTKGWAIKPSVREATAWENKIINTNSRGIRGKTEYSYNKPKGKTRILILGDSFTYGAEVSDTSIYSFQLEQLIANSEVINLGVGGYGHDQMFIYLKEEGIKYRPDIVILGFITDNMKRNLLEFRDYAKPRFILANNKLILRNSPVPKPDQVFKNEFYRLRLFDLIEILYAALKEKLGINNKKAEIITEAIFDEIFKLTNTIGARLIFVHLASKEEMTTPVLQSVDSEIFLTRYCQKNKIPLVLSHPYFLSTQERGVRLRTSGHWDEQGHLLAARLIKKYLVENNLIISY